jgi:hypothetical protein
MGVEIYFDGYCPESMLKGKHVEMKLNEDDFWESLETRLQISVFPPYATILNWRGEGQIKTHRELASNVLTGLILAQPIKENGMEIFPDKDRTINNKEDLASYLKEVLSSKKVLDDAMDNPLKEQEIYLSNLSQKDFAPLFNSFNILKHAGYSEGFRTSKEFRDLFEDIHNLKLVFAFDWTSWDVGKANISNKEFDYKSSSLLELSMYITTIFRADRFNEGTVEQMFRNGIMDKIFEAVKEKSKALN